MHAAANTRTLPFVSENEDFSASEPAALAIDRRSLTPHLERDLGLIDFNGGSARLRRPIDLADLKAGWF
ncbi:MAG TPA: hypothetical protein VMF90_24975 [Rhizobiaceae bacterium]|nr:hypothetical protein [Rhizobiaceae bacterium]